MRIGIVAPPWMSVPPQAYGGTEAVVDRLARGLHRAGHEVMLWTTGDSTCPVPRSHVIPSATPDRIGSSYIELHHVICGYEALAEWGADVVHDHTLAGPVYGPRLGLPVVATNHGPFDDGLTTLYRALAPGVSIVAISHHQAAQAAGVPIAAVIPHGLDLDAYPPGPGAGDGQGDYFLFLGRFAPEKGADQAARAVKAVGGRLVLAAKLREPAEQAFFAEHVEPLLDDDIVYVGEVASEEKLRLLRGATALVNPLRWPEPFGLVMIEALACGTPVVAYRAGAAPEIVDHGTTGYLCGGIEEMAAGLLDAAALDRRRCRAEVERRFSSERMVCDHLALFERTIGRPTPMVA